MLRVAINGFGRIGRNVFKISLDREKDFEIAAINDLTSPRELAHLLKYDSCYGVYGREVSSTDHSIIVDGREIEVLSESDPEKLPWKEMKVDLVVESTGRFASREGAEKHLRAGARKVVIGAPAYDADAMIVVGANQEIYDPAAHNIISMASCTTNCMSLFARLIDEQYGIERGVFTTVHAYTNDQNLLDKPHKDFRRARAAAVSMIPTSSGAAKALGVVLPHLKGKLTGSAVRVPVSAVSLTDVVFDIKKAVTVEEVNEMLKEQAAGPMKGFMGYSEEPLVSIDYKGEENTCVIDALSTLVIDGTMLRVVAWYDNEWGYSGRICDLVNIIAEKEK
ncbi:MAG: type I glyceraldehyde-3-phosphate dehydrogenase [Anaerovoracaceae bacterium]|nr:type I glyceraldehyde-3-phosphate dehydrogenase [Anaerovoracaceae bacterium]